jgi:hypothetical protein
VRRGKLGVYRYRQLVVLGQPEYVVTDVLLN